MPPRNKKRTATDPDYWTVEVTVIREIDVYPDEIAEWRDDHPAEALDDREIAEEIATECVTFEFDTTEDNIADIWASPVSRVPAAMPGRRNGTTTDGTDATTERTTQAATTEAV